MGIRLPHRRKAPARVHATATAETPAGHDGTPQRRPLPALAPGAATPRVPGTPLTAVRERAARLRRRAVALLTRPDGVRRLGAERARGHLTLALGALRRLRRPLAGRRISVFAARAEMGADRFGAR
ncbi:hypothetical protein NFX46_30740 [Streptomyces phaeoluteigriseus]|uniref:Uncharacterized protein n=1 Tax=Streptomyces phaeoluteigriseus TaxID=114686 RepID=A0ABY4ZHD1_9ACTN|nr:hypothetical protein [Streptomyces phaeoluteigriseus]USQ87717.1 hypothetical protein NFX46_30740 [Streptomyces phaeoluteigriseus]